MAVRESDGMLTLVPCTLLYVQCILCAWTAGEASKTTKAKVTCISSKPTTLPRTGCTVGGTEGGGGGGLDKATAYNVTAFSVLGNVPWCWAVDGVRVAINVLCIPYTV